MQIVQTRIPTGNATRYLTQLCQHASAISGGGVGGHMRLMRHARHGGDSQEHGPIKITVERTDSSGVIRFEPHGRCVVEATGTELVVRIEAAEEARLERFREIITGDLSRFGRREKLQITWQRIEEAEGAGAV
jgi:uncharacterized protein